MVKLLFFDKGINEVDNLRAGIRKHCSATLTSSLYNFATEMLEIEARKYKCRFE